MIDIAATCTALSEREPRLRRRDEPDRLADPRLRREPVQRGRHVWYGNVKATQELAKDTFDAINNRVALVLLVVTAVENWWTGTLSANGYQWAFGFTRPQQDLLIQVLSGIVQGNLILGLGC